jgi:hypothetical protein
MMRKYFFAGLLFFCFKETHAQADPVGAFNRHIASNWKGDYIRVSQYHVKGTLYFLGEAFPGSITFRSGKTVDNTKVLYDLYNQKAGIEMNEGLFEADEPVRSFSISLPEKFGNGKLLFKSSAEFGNEDMKAFFNVLADGEKASLLKLYKIKLSPDPTNTMDRDAKVFEQYYEYYLYSKKDLQKIKLKEKDILRALGGDQRLSDFIAKSNLDLSKEADVIQLITNYNLNFQ